MTITEKAVCELYTGYCFCAGRERSAVYEYAERLMGRPVQTFELGTDRICQELHDRSRNDFLKICAGEPLGFRIKSVAKEDRETERRRETWR